MVLEREFLSVQAEASIGGSLHQNLRVGLCERFVACVHATCKKNFLEGLMS